MPFSRRTLLAAPAAWLSTSLTAARAGAVSISPTDFGLTGDGTDETAKLKALAAQLGAQGGVCAFPPNRTYLQSEGVVFAGGGYTIEANGSTIRMMDGAPADFRHFGVMFKGAQFTVRNLIVDGNRQGRKPAERPCHDFFLQGARSGVFENCQAVNAACDGWIIWETDPKNIDTWCQNIVLRDCSADNSFRNGLSVINGIDILVTGGRYDRSNGKSPQAGIDLEPDPGGAEPSLQRVRVVGVTASGNRGFGVAVAKTAALADTSLDTVVVDGAEGGRGAVGFYLGAPVRLRSITTRNLPSERTVYDRR